MFDELLQALLQGSQSQPDAQMPKTQSTQANPWMDMLDGFLGGSSQGTSQNAQAGGIGSLLEAFMGGGTQPNIGANPMLAPITEALSEKLGVSPQMAMVIVSFAFSMIVSSMQKGVSGSMEDRAAQKPEDFLDLDELLDDDYLDSQGITEQLAEQTGLDQDAAKKGLKEAVLLMSGQIAEHDDEPAGSTQAQAGDSLEHLLDSWDA